MWINHFTNNYAFLLIASTALQVGASLVTADSELSKVASLTIVNW
jgi:tRNA(fMet)-specific endonuclease VapC